MNENSQTVQSSEQAQRPKYKEGLMAAEDGSENVSQSVTWSAKFVDRISEVTDSMNVSGKYRLRIDFIRIIQDVFVI